MDSELGCTKNELGYEGVKTGAIDILNIPEFTAVVPKPLDPIDEPAVFGLNTGASTLKAFKSVDDGTTD